jgi:hypothetical protein
MGVNTARYEELWGRLLEGELSDVEAEEMAAGLDISETERRDFQRHLVLWELWSQEQAPERSSEAFVRAWKTRIRAEVEGADAFAGAVRAQIEARESRPNVINFFRRFLAVCYPARIAVASLLMVGLGLALWFAIPQPAQAVTLRGEAVCTACVLHESDKHSPAVRVIAGGATNIYYLERNSAVAGLQDYFCSGPRPVTAQGKSRMEAGRRQFEAGTVTIPDSIKTPGQPTNAPKVLFPI